MWILRSDDSAEGGPYKFRMTAGRVRTLGRGPRADFVLDAALVSRLHCRLLVRDDALIVENLGSTNGTYVNDEPVDRATLRAGDRLRTGRVELTVFAALGPVQE
jgi:pSer/pThr/pTyr-binding forkhead associated (FHA) protein